MISLTYNSTCVEETQALAARLASLLDPGDILTLTGPLGGGKTTFARCLVQALTSPTEEVPSPTFTLVQTYDTPRGEIWHFDLYRLTDPEELWELGFEEAYHGICLIEWPERAASLGLFKKALDLTFAQGAPEDTRLITLTGGTPWQERLKILEQGGPLGRL